MTLHPDSMCECARPLDTGRRYFRRYACKFCDKLIPRCRLDREEAKSWAKRIAMQERDHRVGGLDNGGIPASAKGGWGTSRRAS